jgi:hypothetical protein
MRIRSHVATLGALGGIILVSGAARGAPIIDFNIDAPTTGSIFYVGGANPLVGDNIQVGSITGNNTPFNAGTFECVDCVLNFTTGNFNPVLTALSPADDWIFNGSFGTSTITVFGGVNADGDPELEIGPSLLMEGSFILPQISVDTVDGIGAVGFSTGLFLDVKNPDLSAFFGVSDPIVGALFIRWIGLGEPPGPFVVVPRNGTVRNFFVPEPGSSLVLGAGLLALFVVRRRRARRS